MVSFHEPSAAPFLLLAASESFAMVEIGDAKLCRHAVASLAFLGGQRPLQCLAHGIFNGRKKGLIALLNGLPDALELRCRPENSARLPSIRGIPDTLDDERTYRVVHTLSSQGFARNLSQPRRFGELWLHQSAGVVRSM
jgi:hypothetical protein